MMKIRRAGAILSNRGFKNGVSMMHPQLIPLAAIIQLLMPAVDTVRTDYPTHISDTDLRLLLTIGMKSELSW